MNIVLATDSYKLNHWNQYPKGTEAVYSYFEARTGAEYDETVFFGLQSVLKNYLQGPVVTREKIDAAERLANIHFGRPGMFNRAGWEHILAKHNGYLPVRIKAVPEGTPVPTSNVLMTVENTDPACFWLTNHLESVLTHVWHPSTVASRSRAVKKMLAQKLLTAGATLDGLPFMLHDFGYRGAASHESAALGGAGHLVNFLGTDTLPAMELAMADYNADPATLAFSVPATEHSVMTSLGRGGEMDLVERLIAEYPTGILSVVADSYNIYEFVRFIGSRLKRQIMERDGVFVVRPDSTTFEDPTPGALTARILESLAMDFGTTTNERGFKVLDPHVRVLWGDGINANGIEKIVNDALLRGFSPENLVFGMGGGLLQKLNRDTQRFAFKSSAQKRNGEWHDIFKKPLDVSKASKKGRLALVRGGDNSFHTLSEAAYGDEDVLRTVFEDGLLTVNDTFEQVRERAAL
jgi:nicotinamide phosphoribosyltransferase